LRAIPRAFLRRILKLPASGYEFELEMLIAAKHVGLRIIERPIRSIYEHGNPSSHSHPLRDSMRFGSVLLRFSAIGILTAVLDNVIFYVLYQKTGNLIASRLVHVSRVFSSAIPLSEERFFFATNRI
jgi:hypothetical protein